MIEEYIFDLYWKLGLFFTGKRRTRPFYISQMILLIVIIFLSILYKNVIKEDTLYWVFSSLVQALLALVGFLGAASIFQINRDKEKVNNYFVPTYLQKFVVYTFAVVLISLIFLIFTPIISKYYLGSTTLYIIFMLTARSLFLVAKNTAEFF